MTDYNWDNFDGVEVENKAVSINWGVIKEKGEANFTVVEVKKGVTGESSKYPGTLKVDVWLKFEGEDEDGEIVTYKGRYPSVTLPIPLGNIDEKTKGNYLKNWSSFTNATGKTKQDKAFTITPPLVDVYCEVGLTGKCTVKKSPYSYIDKETGETKTGFNNELWYFMTPKKGDNVSEKKPNQMPPAPDFNGLVDESEINFDAPENDIPF